MILRAGLLGLAAGFAILLAGCSLYAVTGSKGTMPPPGPNGEIDPSAVPDFVAVARPDGVAGYVARDAVLGGATDRSWPVYGDDLRTIVGQLMPGRGFVPIGIDPATIPTFDVHAAPAEPGDTPTDGEVLAYVRNASPSEAWIAVITNGQIQLGGGGFPAGGYVVVWCDLVPLGSRLVLLDRSPVDRNALPKQTIYFGAPATGSVSRWIDVPPDGVTTVGSGEPEWWTGGPPPC